jgi:hypothetical protein
MTPSHPNLFEIESPQVSFGEIIGRVRLDDLRGARLGSSGLDAYCNRWAALAVGEGDREHRAQPAQCGQAKCGGRRDGGGGAGI